MPIIYYIKSPIMKDMVTFVEEHHYFGEGFHEVDVVIAVLLNLEQ